MTFTFSGFMLLHVPHVNMVAVIAHAPWLLLATHVLLSSNERRARAIASASVALLLGSQLLLGHPQMVWMTMLVNGVLALCLTMSGVPRRHLVQLAWALVLGGLIGGVQLLPTLDVLQGSTRNAASLPFSLSYSVSPVNLIQFLCPLAFKARVYAPPQEIVTHELSLYNGAFCSVSLLWLMVRWRALSHKSLLRVLLVVAVVGLVLALGRYGGAYRLLAAVPGMNAFRVPGRYVVLLHLALGGIAAIAFEDLIAVASSDDRVPLRRLWPLALFACLSVATTLVLARADEAWAAANGLRLSPLAYSGPWMCLVILMVGIVAMAARGRRWALPAIVLLTALELGGWGYKDFLNAPSATVAAMAAGAPVPPEAQAGDSFEMIVKHNRAVMRDMRIATGYVGLEPASSIDPGSSLGLRIAGITWRHTTGAWERAADAMPRARLLSSVRRSFANDVHNIDIARLALVDAPLEGLSGRDGTVRLLLERPGRIRVETMAPGRQLLVTTERFHKGWRAREDGRDCPPIRVYGDYLACVVNAGTHVVEFTFVPATFRLGIVMTVLGLVLTALTALTAVVRRSPTRPMFPVV